MIFLFSLSSRFRGRIDPLHKWLPNLSNNNVYILSLVFMFQDKGLSHECEAKDVTSIVIQIWAPFMQRVYSLKFFYHSLAILFCRLSPVSYNNRKDKNILSGRKKKFLW